LSSATAHSKLLACLLAKLNDIRLRSSNDVNRGYRFDLTGCAHVQQIYKKSQNTTKQFYFCLHAVVLQLCESLQQSTGSLQVSGVMFCSVNKRNPLLKNDDNRFQLHTAVLLYFTAQCPNPTTIQRAANSHTTNICSRTTL